MGRLFGTDGVRGVANSELTCELAMKIGRAAAMVLTEGKKGNTKVLIGKDTRLSSDMLESALTAGLCSIGVDVISLGVVPTPAVAFLVGKYKADAGVMISASHNSYEFNGIKIFSGDGYKLPDALEEQIEAIVLDDVKVPVLPVGEDVGHVSIAENAVKDYIDHIKCTVPFSLDGLKVAFDCSNGSASRTAERLFTELGAECHMLFDKPNGVNINDNCGSTHMEDLMDYVREHDVDVGIAFDGDADRCLAVDEKGNVERHAWNYVYIKNNWYAVDTTWDDPIIVGIGKINESIKYKYFLKGKEDMDKDHTPNGQVTKDGFKFSYPELAKENIK